MCSLIKYLRFAFLRPMYVAGRFPHIVSPEIKITIVMRSRSEMFSTVTLLSLIFHVIKYTNNFNLQSVWGFFTHNTTCFNPFQSNFSANRILPSSYFFWAVKRLVDYL
jgi:hypothetical protein